MEIRALSYNCFFGAHFVQVSPLRATARCTYPPLPTGKGEGLRAAGPDHPGSVWEEEMLLLGWHKGTIIGAGNLLLFYTSKKKTNMSPQKGPFQKRNVVFQVFVQQPCQFSGGSNVSRHLEPPLPTSKKRP